MKGLQVAWIVACTLFSTSALATEYHVATTGSDANPGTSASPWKTIQKAAETMQPGDTCTVHEGTYREWVRPRQGGTSDTARIVYQAAAGETVYLKGSEPVTGWTQDSGAYKAVVPNSTFGSYNPYSTNLQGGWLDYGGEYHLGQVYIDGDPLVEALDVATVAATPKTFYAEVGSQTTIWANFGTDPAAHLVEINVRESAIKPETLGLAYITIDGFYIMHGATQWSPPTQPQYGMVNMMQGHHWLIQNNHVSDSRAVGIMCGTEANGLSTQDITKNGNHVVRYNTIQRCGEAGIAGENRWPNSLIENNLIEDINWTMQFGGWETAGVKIHDAVDVVIRNNIIRRVRTQLWNKDIHNGIWLDWAGQGSRITGNVIYDIDQAIINIEMAHGPTLIDNNILAGGTQNGGFSTDSENDVLVHNLFVDAGWSGTLTDSRSSGYWVPHTTHGAGSKQQSAAEDRYLNNIYVRVGTDGVSDWPGYQIDYNVFYEGALKSSGKDAHSVSHDSFTTNVMLETLPDGVRVWLTTDSAPNDVQAPLLTRDYIGINTVTKQGIEYHDGSPITIDKDILGAARSATHPTAGPFEGAPTTKTAYVFKAGVGADTWATMATSDGGVITYVDGGPKPVQSDAGTKVDGKAPVGAKDAAVPGSNDTGTGGSVEPTTEDEGVTADNGGGCACDASRSAPTGAAWLLFLAALLGARTDRSRRR